MEFWGDLLHSTWQRLSEIGHGSYDRDGQEQSCIVALLCPLTTHFSPFIPSTEHISMDPKEELWEFLLELT